MQLKDKLKELQKMLGVIPADLGEFRQLLANISGSDDPSYVAMAAEEYAEYLKTRYFPFVMGTCYDTNEELEGRFTVLSPPEYQAEMMSFLKKAKPPQIIAFFNASAEALAHLQKDESKKSEFNVPHLPPGVAIYLYKLALPMDGDVALSTAKFLNHCNCVDNFPLAEVFADNLDDAVKMFKSDDPAYRDCGFELVGIMGRGFMEMGCLEKWRDQHFEDLLNDSNPALAVKALHLYTNLAFWGNYLGTLFTKKAIKAIDQYVHTHPASELFKPWAVDEARKNLAHIGIELPQA